MHPSGVFHASVKIVLVWNGLHFFHITEKANAACAHGTSMFIFAATQIIVENDSNKFYYLTFSGFWGALFQSFTTI